MPLGGNYEPYLVDLHLTDEISGKFFHRRQILLEFTRSLYKDRKILLPELILKLISL